MRIKRYWALLVWLALAAPASPAQAGGIVSVCDEAHLRAALAGGGTVTFACSGTITLTAEIAIAADTTIDGSGQAVTISGNDTVRVFNVQTGGAFNLNALTIAHGAVRDYEHGGGIAIRAGALTVSHTTFLANSASSGGAVSQVGGVATFTHSAFTGNSATPYGPNSPSTGGGILNDGGALHVDHCIFSGNSSLGGGGAIDNLGTLTVNNSIFSGNSAASGRSTGGGGIGNWFGGRATIDNSTFSGNRADGYTGAGGGGIVNDGTLSVTNSTFSGNSTSADYGATGGGIDSTGSLTVSNSTFAGNSVAPGEFMGGGGGGIFSGGTLTVVNSTFSGNSAAFGGGIAGGGTATLKNTIVANSGAGANCSGSIADGGGNLSYPDATCPGITGDPLLGPLQDNGGPTPTMDLGPGSAAFEAGNAAACAAAPVNNLDQRGVVRPQGARCDSGAVEHRFPFWRWFAVARAR